jgi:hypothetical protein
VQFIEQEFKKQEFASNKLSWNFPFKISLTIQVYFYILQPVTFNWREVRGQSGMPQELLSFMYALKCLSTRVSQMKTVKLR